MRIICGLSSQRSLLTPSQLRLQRLRDSFGDLGLDAENITQLSVIHFGPELRAGLHVNQMNVDPHLIACLLNATLKDVRYAKLLRDFSKIARFALISLRRSTRNDFQIADLSETRQDFFLDAIGEISIIRIAA